jgi:hypothetical protein
MEILRFLRRAIATKVAVAQIVRDHEDDVGFGFGRSGMMETGEGEQQSGDDEPLHD